VNREDFNSSIKEAGLDKVGTTVRPALFVWEQQSNCSAQVQAGWLKVYRRIASTIPGLSGQALAVHEFLIGERMAALEDLCSIYREQRSLPALRDQYLLRAFNYCSSAATSSKLTAELFVAVLCFSFPAPIRPDLEAVCRHEDQMTALLKILYLRCDLLEQDADHRWAHIKCRARSRHLKPPDLVLADKGCTAVCSEWLRQMKQLHELLGLRASNTAAAAEQQPPQQPQQALQQQQQRVRTASVTAQHSSTVKQQQQRSAEVSAGRRAFARPALPERHRTSSSIKSIKRLAQQQQQQQPQRSASLQPRRHSLPPELAKYVGAYTCTDKAWVARSERRLSLTALEQQQWQQQQQQWQPPAVPNTADLYAAAEARAHQRAATFATDELLPQGDRSGSSRASTNTSSVLEQGYAERACTELLSAGALTLQQLAAQPSPVLRGDLRGADVAIGESPAVNDTPQSTLTHSHSASHSSSSNSSNSGNSSSSEQQLGGDELVPPLLGPVQSAGVQQVAAAAGTLYHESQQHHQSHHQHQQQQQQQQFEQQEELPALLTGQELPLPSLRTTSRSSSSRARLPPLPPASRMTSARQRSAEHSSSAPLALAPTSVVAHASNSNTAHSTTSSSTRGASPVSELPPASTTVQHYAHTEPAVAGTVADVSGGMSLGLGDSPHVDAVGQRHSRSSSSYSGSVSVSAGGLPVTRDESQQPPATPATPAVASTTAAAAAAAQQQQAQSRRLPAVSGRRGWTLQQAGLSPAAHAVGRSTGLRASRSTLADAEADVIRGESHETDGDLPQSDAHHARVASSGAAPPPAAAASATSANSTAAGTSRLAEPRRRRFEEALSRDTPLAMAKFKAHLLAKRAASLALQAAVPAQQQQQQQRSASGNAVQSCTARSSTSISTLLLARGSPVLNRAIELYSIGDSAGSVQFAAPQQQQQQQSAVAASPSNAHTGRLLRSNVLINPHTGGTMSITRLDAVVSSARLICIFHA
jgi:hypothetical protein